VPAGLAVSFGVVLCPAASSGAAASEALIKKTDRTRGSEWVDRIKAAFRAK
jgi:hypothetical protein